MKNDRTIRKFNPEIVPILEKYHAEFGSLRSKPMAMTILENEKQVSYSIEHFSKLIRDWRKATGFERTPIAEQHTIPVKQDHPHDKYEVNDGHYQWTTSLGEIKIPVEEADQMFYEYSRHGLDMSQSQMRNKHSLKIWEWHAIKRALFMYKDSNIFSPHTEENTPKSELQQMIESKMEEKMDDRQRLIENAYNKETLKRYKKAILNDNVKTFARETITDELADLMADWKSKVAVTYKSNCETCDANTQHLIVTIADIHIGALSTDLVNTPDYSVEIARQKLLKIADIINRANPAKVTIAFMGDIIESFTGMNHPNSWHGVEQGMIGAKLIRAALELIEEFVSKIYNVRQILAVSGNHDRITASNKEDNRGQVSEILFYMLGRLYKDTIPVKHSDLLITEEIDGIQYVMAHGDKKTFRDGKQVVIDHGNNKLFNVILTGHTHVRRIIEDERSYRWIALPSIFSGNRYSEENGWNSRAGFVTFQNDGTGLPIVIDYTV